MGNRFSGFTLSEVIISLGIIGIISAITVPGIITRYQNDAMLVTLKKTYSEIDQNITMLAADSYGNKLSKTVLNKKSTKTIDETAGKFLKDSFKIIQDCALTPQPCFANKYRAINNAEEKEFSCSAKRGYSVQTASGAAICIMPLNSTRNYARVYLDVNGAEKPNIGGRDMFTFKIYEDFKIDEVDEHTAAARHTLFESKCKNSDVGSGCFGKILNDNWKMKY